MNAAAILLLAQKGLSALDIAEVAAALEADSKPDTAAERRRAWDRERKREQRLSGGMSGGNPPDPAPNERDNLTPTRERKSKAKALVKKRLPIPDDWQPGPFGLNTESRKVVDSWPPGEQAAQLEQMKAYHRSKHNTFLDPQDAWSTWVLNTRKWGIGRNERSTNPTVDAASRILRDLRANDPASQDPHAGGPNVHDDGAARSLVARRH